MARAAGALALALLFGSARAAAQVPASAAGVPSQPGYAGGAYATAPNYSSGYSGAYPTPYAASGSRSRSGTEIAFLYATSVAYGIGAGIWFDSELRVKDPGLFLISPAVLAIAAPAAVYVLDNPELPRGVPAAVAAGAVIGAGEGIGVASLQFVTATRSDAWGFRGLARATTLGATLGIGGGVALGYLQRPSPRSSVFMTSGVAWGSAIGAMFGYGASAGGVGYGAANDKAALGGFIGYNLGLVATGALSTVYIPTTQSLEWMWAGAGIGFVASLPVFLLYTGDNSPTAKRGLLFSGTATTLGLAAGAVFTAGTHETASGDRPAFARVTAIAPLAVPHSTGISVFGDLD